MRVEPFVLLWAAAGLLQCEDFVAQAVPILRAKYEGWFEDGVLAAMRLSAGVVSTLWSLHKTVNSWLKQQTTT